MRFIPITLSMKQTQSVYKQAFKKESQHFFY